ncbi:MAG: hypothetical protein ACOXZ0_08340 [Eubacteriales bacterium]|jgi:hypothetical protein
MKLRQTEFIIYKGCRITLNANLETGEFIAVTSAVGRVITNRDLSAIKAVDGIKKKIDEVET